MKHEPKLRIGQSVKLNTIDGPEIGRVVGCGVCGAYSEGDHSFFVYLVEHRNPSGGLRVDVFGTMIEDGAVCSP